MFEECLNGVSMKLQVLLMDVSSSFKKFQGCVDIILRVFQESFKDVSRGF